MPKAWFLGAVFGIVDQFSGGRSDQNQKIKLWDFNGYNIFTIEDKTPMESLVLIMKWYWELCTIMISLGVGFLTAFTTIKMMAEILQAILGY